MLTRAGWATLAGGALTLAAARLLAIPELFIIGSAAFVLPLLAVAWVRRRLSAFTVARVVTPRRVHLGHPSRVELQVRNGGSRRSPVLVLRDPVAGTVGARVALGPLAPGGATEAGYRLPTEHRGLVQIGPLGAELADPFGLARRRFDVAGRTQLVVLPAIEALRGLPPAGGRDQPRPGLASGVGMGPGADDLATLRPYAVGDDLRRVHWPSSARTGDLLVRQDDVHWQGHLTLVLDGRTRRVAEEPFERSVSAAASLLHLASRKGDRVRLLADGLDSGLVSARTAADRLLEHLALADRHDRDDLPPLANAPGGGGSLVVLTGRPTEEDLASLALKRRTFASVVVVAALPSETPAAALPPMPTGIDLVVIDGFRPFPAAWADLLTTGRTR